MMLPGCMVVGAILPGFVTVAPIEVAEVAGPSPDLPPLRVPKIPNIGPREVTISHVDLGELISLISRSPTLETPSEARTRLARLAVEEELEEVEETIALEEEGEEEEAAGPYTGAQPEVIESVLRVDKTPIWDTALFDRIPWHLDFVGASEFDDFAGPRIPALDGPPPAPAVPEPGTATLLGTGLLVLAIWRRRR